MSSQRDEFPVDEFTGMICRDEFPGMSSRRDEFPEDEFPWMSSRDEVPGMSSRDEFPGG